MRHASALVLAALLACARADPAPPVTVPLNPVSAPPPQVAPSPVDTTPPPSSREPLGEGVVRTGPGRYEVTRAFTESLFDPESDVIKRTCSEMAKAGGRVLGVRLFCLRPDSTLTMLGFENGDIVQRLNGVPLTSVDRALEAYEAARKTSAIRVDVLRRGESLVFVYDVM